MENQTNTTEETVWNSVYLSLKHIKKKKKGKSVNDLEVLVRNKLSLLSAGMFPISSHSPVLNYKNKIFNIIFNFIHSLLPTN